MSRRNKCLPRLLLVGLAYALLTACATTHSDRLNESTVSSHTYKPGVGGISKQVTSVEADVIAIDYPNHQVTLQDAQGNKRTLKIGSGSGNFSEIKVGDHFLLQIAREMAVYLFNAQSTALSAERPVDLKAPQGEKPAFLMANTRELKAVIIAVDPAGRMATLRFEDGTNESFEVRPDVQLDDGLIGQAIIIRMTDAIALSVTAK